MKSLHIRDVAPQTLEALKRLARQHHRSLQGELHAMLERAARMAPPEQPRELNLNTVDTGRTGEFTREDIYGDSGR